MVCLSCLVSSCASFHLPGGEGELPCDAQLLPSRCQLIKNVGERLC